MKQITYGILVCCGWMVASMVGASDWSIFSGDGSFSPPPAGLELVDDLGDARRDWVNPVMTGVGKTSGGGYLETLERGAEQAFYGGVDNLIVAEGRVFATFARPSGDAIADRDTIQHRYFSEERKQALPDSTFRIVADDVTVALDAETGETLWEAVETGETLNMLSSKRGLPGISGAYADGRFFAMGLMGRVYAYDASTGDKLWDHTLEDWHRQIGTLRDGHLEKRMLPSARELGPLSYQRGGLVVAGGTLVAPDFRNGLIGLDPKDGTLRWRRGGVSLNAAVPVVWRDGGREFLLTTGPAGGRDMESTRIHLIDPQDGSSVWTVDSGANRSTLITEGDRLLLNTRGSSTAEESGFHKGAGLLACHRISTEGLTEIWRFEDHPAFHYEFTPDTGRRRRAVFQGDRLFIRLGVGDKAKRRLYSVDAETGGILDRSEPVGGNVSLPYAVEDRLFWHLDVAHSGRPAGFMMFRVTPEGKMEPAGQVQFTAFDVLMATGYELPTETPYWNGRFYLRGMPGVAAIDVRKDEDAPEMRLELTDAWGGAPKPVEVKLLLSRDGSVKSGMVDPPTHRELGVPLTTARRKDARAPVEWTEAPTLTPEGLEGTLRLGFGPFAWDCRLDLDPAADNRLEGTWTREIPALEEPYTREGRIVGKGGWDQRVMPTPWLKHSPLTVYSELPEGWERMKLALEGGVVDGKGNPRWYTLFLEYKGENLKGGVAIATQFNQAWHEVDVSGLTLKGDRITGEVLTVANPDLWWAPNEKTGTAMAGRITIDATRGEGDPHDITGTYTVEWGIPLTREGKVSAVLGGAHPPLKP